MTVFPGPEKPLPEDACEMHSQQDPFEPFRIRDRYARWKWIAYFLMLAGFAALLLARRWFHESIAGQRLVPGLAVFLSVVFAVAASTLYARIKGRSSWLGLLGIMNIVGYLVLVFMKKRCHRCGVLSPDSIDDCPSCGAPI